MKNLKVGKLLIMGIPSKINIRVKQAEAEVVPSSSSVKAKLRLVKLLLEIKLSFSCDF